ncbi:MAG: KOW domain-containing RNA-binding protein [Oscillospiraceae bacterium]
MQLAIVVQSQAGHDKGDWFAVTGIEGDFALIADGKHRPLEAPKRKRLKHLAPTCTVLSPGQMRTNRQLRQALSLFRTCMSKEGNDLGKG